MGLHSLRVSSIFTSIDGEVNAFGQGCLTTFIRLSGCNLRCWESTGGCDTPHALSSETGTHQVMSVEEIMTHVLNTGIKKVTITGGEPLLQKDNIGGLLMSLDAASIGISVETNGTFMPDCEGHWAVGSWVYDHKCPSTGESGKMVPFSSLYGRLCELDYIKFVIADDNDYDYAVKLVRSVPYRPTAPVIAFSAMAGAMEPSALVQKMIDDKLNDVRFNLQMHKHIWPNSTVER